uniref:NADH dehydrogenase subunit 6 n=1 Tax=Synchytrium taraxaci TaxID=1383262 RepID=A0A4P8NWI5_9FUNG|nr:NADH dehydrogenase subunit 6 [Synchytrium taraxaci]
MSLLYYFLVFAILISNLVVLSALNPIHRMVWLIVVFVLGSFLFLVLDFLFIGLTYIIVYVGALAILFLFVIMMVQIPSGQMGSLHRRELPLPLEFESVPISNLGPDPYGTNALSAPSASLNRRGAPAAPRLSFSETTLKFNRGAIPPVGRSHAPFWRGPAWLDPWSWPFWSPALLARGSGLRPSTRSEASGGLPQGCARLMQKPTNWNLVRKSASAPQGAAPRAFAQSGAPLGSLTFGFPIILILILIFLLSSFLFSLVPKLDLRSCWTLGESGAGAVVQPILVLLEGTPKLAQNGAWLSQALPSLDLLPDELSFAQTLFSQTVDMAWGLWEARNQTNSFAIYYYSSWFELYKNFTDIETLANMIYIAYPSALVFLGLLLWSVLIGVIQITKKFPFF